MFEEGTGRRRKMYKDIAERSLIFDVGDSMDEFL